MMLPFWINIGLTTGIFVFGLILGIQDSLKEPKRNFWTVFIMIAFYGFYLCGNICILRRMVLGWDCP